MMIIFCIWGEEQVSGRSSVIGSVSLSSLGPAAGAKLLIVTDGHWSPGHEEPQKTSSTLFWHFNSFHCLSRGCLWFDNMYHPLPKLRYMCLLEQKTSNQSKYIWWPYRSSVHRAQCVVWGGQQPHYGGGVTSSYWAGAGDTKPIM